MPDDLLLSPWMWVAAALGVVLFMLGVVALFRQRPLQFVRRLLLALRLLSAGALAAPTLAAAAASPARAQATAQATFAGGCFWCTESDFDKVPGVISTTSGYTGGSVANPTYQQVSAETTGHAEAVQIVLDPAKVSYEQLLEKFWTSIDPTTRDRQLCDVGTPYRTAIFAHDAVLALNHLTAAIIAFRKVPLAVTIIYG